MKKSAALGAAFVTAALLVLSPRASAAQTNGTGVPAASETEAVSLLYEDSPPPDCPTEAEFEAEVEKLTSKARFTKERRARRVRIELASGSRDVFGRFVTGDGKNQSSREVRGKTCREVASALAIAVALTIDPEALLGPAEPKKDPPPPEPTTLPETQTKPPPPATKPPLPKPAPKPAPAPAPLPRRWYAGLAVGVVLESAWAPSMRTGGKLLGAVAYGERIRGSVGVARFITQEVDEVSFGAWMGDASMSYNVLVLGVLRPFVSAGYEFGIVQAAGSGLPATVEARRPWQAGLFGLGFRIETSGFFLQLGGSLLVPFSRQRYLVSDPVGKVRSLYETPSLGLRQETSVGVFL